MLQSAIGVPTKFSLMGLVIVTDYMLNVMSLSDSPTPPKNPLVLGVVPQSDLVHGSHHLVG